jgi:asparagine synthase (glutamine-hydrolysing)
MCGIAGVIDPKLAEKEQVIGEMVKIISHRGPDDDGFFVDNFVGLGMRRLSIIDLSTGRQPITSEDENKLIFLNGEIYNYQELRDELEKDYKFKTKTDTEVILHLYEKYGEKMLTKLRGMFCFCIYDLEAKTVFLARDYFGIKPLYYLVGKPDSVDDGQKIVAFSSEIKSFMSFPGFKPDVNDQAVYNYLAFQYNPLVETFFKGVYKLPPAHFMKINVMTGETEIKKYWSFEFSHAGMPLNQKEVAEAADAVYETVKDSVKHHMIADVPVGSFLSGGVDSSIIATMMQSIRGDKKIKTFTVGFDTLTEGNESKETSDFLGTDHTEITIGADEYFEILPKAAWHFDEPVADPSAIGLYFVAREARKHVTVVLSGEGADEFFGGYNIYLAPFEYRKISWVPKFILKSMLSLPFEYTGKNYIRRAFNKIDTWYVGNASIFKPEEIKKIWKSDSPGEQKMKLLSLKPLFDKVRGVSDSVKMQYIDINTWLVGDILAKADKMTMANSLELRVPFLDVEVAKLASVLPDNLKWRNGTTKYILREAFSDVIPESTRLRKKLGFPTPVRDWFTEDRIELYKQIINNKYIAKHFDVEYIKLLIDDHVHKRADNARKIYLLLMLAIWYDIFIDPPVKEITTKKRIKTKK